MLKQVSVFMENTKGSIYDLISLFSGESINLSGLMATGSAEYGIVRLLVSDSEKTSQILEKAGYLCQKSQVLGVEIPDEPGALEYLLKIIRDMDITVDYLYMSYNRYTGWPTVIMHCDRMDEAENSLKRMGYSMV